MKNNEKKPTWINQLSNAAVYILPYLHPTDLSSISLTCKTLYLIVKSITAVRSSDASNNSEKHPIPYINPGIDTHPYSYFIYTPSQIIGSTDDPTPYPWGPSSARRPDPDPIRSPAVENGRKCECKRSDGDLCSEGRPDPDPIRYRAGVHGRKCECNRSDGDLCLDGRPDPDPDSIRFRVVEDGVGCECERSDVDLCSDCRPDPEPDPDLIRTRAGEDGVGCECERSDGDLDGCPCSRFKVSGLVWECGSGCRCGSECRNRVSQRGVSVRLKIVRSLRKGWGLHADEFIKGGEFICEYAGELLTTKEARKRQLVYDKLASSGRHTSALLVAREHLPSGNACMRINVDATRIGNVARFINHSCDGGNLSTVLVRSSGALLPRVCFFASRDILKDEELTFSYGDSGLNPTGSKCFCGSSCCSGIMPSEHT